MNLVTIYGIYGDHLGIRIYPFFDMNSLASSVLAQILIMGFGTNYVPAFWCFFVVSIVGFFVADLVDYTPLAKRSRASSDSLLMDA